MKLTKEQEIERIFLAFVESLTSATLHMVKTNTDLPMDQRKAFATGMLCAVDGIKDTLMPTIKEAVKENPRYFENLN
jgi:hypothetical protein